jgi:hypothetical protein
MALDMEASRIGTWKGRKERLTVYVNRMETTQARTQHGYGHGNGVWMIPLLIF